MKNVDPVEGFTARSVQEHELDEFLQLMCRAFNLDFTTARPIYYSDPFYDPSLKRALINDVTHRIVSGLTIVPATLRLPGGAVIAVAGIAGVSTHPELQRRGFGRQLLDATVAALPGLGFHLAALTAEAPALYQRAGFEFCSAPVYWEASGTGHFPAYSEGRAVHVYSYEQWAGEAKLIRMLYRHAFGSILGTYQRDARRWANIESPSVRRSIAVWKNGASLEAYVIFQEKPENGNVSLMLLEMVSASEAGCRALTGFIARRQGISIVKGQMRGLDIVRFGLHKTAGVTFRVEPGMLVRITDLESILTTAAANPQWCDLLAECESGLTIRVEESSMAWDQKSLRLFAVRDRSGDFRCALAPSDELIGDWISLEGHALSQLVTGFKSVRQMHSEGRLRASGDAALTLSERLFPMCEPYLGPLDAF